MGAAFSITSRFFQGWVLKTPIARQNEHEISVICGIVLALLKGGS
jgi:hypothetical protein